MDKTNRLCRTCQKLVTENGFIDLNKEDNSAQTSRIKLMLRTFLPEIEPNLVLNPIMCLDCFNMLNTACEFRDKCLQVEGKETEDCGNDNFVAVNVKQEIADEKPISSDFEGCNVYVKEEPNDVMMYCDSDVKIKSEINEFT